MPYHEGNISVLVEDQRGRKFVAIVEASLWVPLEAGDVGAECVPTMLLQVMRADGRLLFQLPHSHSLGIDRGAR